MAENLPRFTDPYDSTRELEVIAIASGARGEWAEIQGSEALVASATAGDRPNFVSLAIRVAAASE